MLLDAFNVKIEVNSFFLAPSKKKTKKRQPSVCNIVPGTISLKTVSDMPVQDLFQKYAQQLHLLFPCKSTRYFSAQHLGVSKLTSHYRITINNQNYNIGLNMKYSGRGLKGVF